jgi:hypothetical protein
VSVHQVINPIILHKEAVGSSFCRRVPSTLTRGDFAQLGCELIRSASGVARRDERVLAYGGPLRASGTNGADTSSVTQPETRH